MTILVPGQRSDADPATPPAAGAGAAHATGAADAASSPTPGSTPGEFGRRPGDGPAGDARTGSSTGAGPAWQLQLPLAAPRPGLPPIAVPPRRLSGPAASEPDPLPGAVAASTVVPDGPVAQVGRAAPDAPIAPDAPVGPPDPPAGTAEAAAGPVAVAASAVAVATAPGLDETHRGDEADGAPSGPDVLPVPDPAPVAAPDRRARKAAAARSKALHKPWTLDALEWIGLVAGALLVALVVKALLFQAFVIPSRSMEPTLGIGNRVLVFKLSYHIGEVGRGDVVVFARPPMLKDGQDNSDLIKRVIGLPGDVVEGRNGRVYVNSELVTESWLARPPLTSDFGPITVPEGKLWVMGDNRENSQDSRVFGFLDQSSLRGRAFLRWWPLSRFAGL